MRTSCDDFLLNDFSLSIDSAEDKEEDEKCKQEAEDCAKSDTDDGAWRRAVSDVGICGWYDQYLLLPLDDRQFCDSS